MLLILLCHAGHSMATSQGSAQTFISLPDSLLGGRTVVPNLLLNLLSEKIFRIT